MLAHTVFGMAFVTAVVRTRLTHADTSLEEASRDLGATPFTTFFRVTLPQLAPGIVAGALLAFTLSHRRVRDRVLHGGATEPTLPIVIYSMVRFGVTPRSTRWPRCCSLVSFTAVIVAQRMTRLTESLS